MSKIEQLSDGNENSRGLLKGGRKQPDDGFKNAEAELRCAFDLRPVPPRRKVYCREKCQRAARNFRRRCAQ